MKIERIVIDQYKSENKISDIELSKRANIGYATLMRIKNDKNYNPGKSIILKLSDAMNKDPSVFFKEVA